MSRFLVLLFIASSTTAAPPPNLVVDGIPAIPAVLREKAKPYLQLGMIRFYGWHPSKREVLISFRGANQQSAQLHLVNAPQIKPRVLTNGVEPIRDGAFQPRKGRDVLFSRDMGGNETHQLFRINPNAKKPVPILLSDGRSRFTSGKWSPDGKRVAYMSNQRNGHDYDLYVMESARPQGSKKLVELKGGGWQIMDWAPNGAILLLREYVSINESYLHIVDVQSGTVSSLTPRTKRTVSRGMARFGSDMTKVYFTDDVDGEYQQLCQLDLSSGVRRVLTPESKWDVEEFDISPTGDMVAFVRNEAGYGRLHLLDLIASEEETPKLPMGRISQLHWRPNGIELGFSLNAADSPGDVYSWNRATGKLERWTQAPLHGIDAKALAWPSLVKVPSFDEQLIPAFIYLPDEKKFPGPRPVVIWIHGGPESQWRPGFLGHYNFLINHLGVALVAPNVRGSRGYGRSYLLLDNGLARANTVTDIAAVLNHIYRHPRLDGSSVAVMGGSYGGFMALACMARFNSFLRCGVDVVGISNFVTFLKNTKGYRRDLRRAEYGDERDPKMKKFLEAISPMNNVEKITRPLLIVQGANDPRVPASESEQMKKALRDRGNAVWYLLAKDEGHGFRKRTNREYQFLSTILFLKQYLLGDSHKPTKPGG